MRGPQLYRKHIPNLDKFDWYRRRFEIQFEANSHHGEAMTANEPARKVLAHERQK